MKNWKMNIQNLLLTMRPYRGEMSVAILCALLKQASVIGAAALTSYVVGLALQGDFRSNRTILIGCLIACILIRAIAFFGEMYFAHDVAFRVIRNYRVSLYDKICMIAPAYTLRTQTGQLGQSLVADVEILELFLAHTFSSFLVACAVTVIIIGVLFHISPILSRCTALLGSILQKEAVGPGRGETERCFGRSQYRAGRKCTGASGNHDSAWHGAV